MYEETFKDFKPEQILKDGGTKKLVNLSKMKTLEHIAYIAEKTDSLKYP